MTMKVPRKRKKVVQVCNTYLVLSKFMYFLSANWIKINNLFLYELAPAQTAFYKYTGEGRFPTSKVYLKDVLRRRFSKEFYPGGNPHRWMHNDSENFTPTKRW